MSIISPDKLSLSAEPIGKGLSAYVYVAQVNGQQVAVKQFIHRHAEFDNELSLLKTIKHENIIKFLGYYKAPKQKYLVLELLPGGDMTTYLSNNKPNNWLVLSKLHLQIIDGMRYLHSRKIVHADLKYENILLNKDKTIKITDFGISHRVGKSIERSKTVLGTYYYMASEVVNGWKAVYESDVWSFGCMLYYTTTGYTPYSNIPFQTLFSLLQTDQPIPLQPISLVGQNIPSNFLKIAEASLHWHLDQRPSFETMKIFLQSGTWRDNVGPRTKIAGSIAVLRPPAGSKARKGSSKKSGKRVKRLSKRFRGY